MKKLNLVLLSVFCFPVLSYGAGCEEYPYTDGTNIEDVSGGTKILSTATATVSFDDPDSVRDAKDEATLLAKAAISKFLSEIVSSDEVINKAVNETKSMSGEAKSSVRKETIERVKTLRNSSQALLRGVVLLGDCYTKGKEVRVSVGLKPETIESAGKVAGGIANSVAAKPTPTAISTGTGVTGAPAPSTPGSGSVSTPLQGVDSHNNTVRLKSF